MNPQLAISLQRTIDADHRRAVEHARLAAAATATTTTRKSRPQPSQSLTLLHRARRIHLGDVLFGGMLHRA